MALDVVTAIGVTSLFASAGEGGSGVTSYFISKISSSFLKRAFSFNVLFMLFFSNSGAFLS